MPSSAMMNGPAGMVSSGSAPPSFGRLSLVPPIGLRPRLGLTAKPPARLRLISSDLISAD
jgi:hypothetical protein